MDPGGNFDEKQDACVVLKCLFPDCLLVTRGKRMLAIQGRNRTSSWVTKINFRWVNGHDVLPDVMA